MEITPSLTSLFPSRNGSRSTSSIKLSRCTADHRRAHRGVTMFGERTRRTDHLWDPRRASNSSRGATRPRGRNRFADAWLCSGYVPTRAPWYPALRAELLSFPAGKYDDQVDALGLIGQLLDRITARQKPKAPDENKIDMDISRMERCLAKAQECERMAVQARDQNAKAT